MPYGIKRNHPSCPKDKPHAVVKSNSGSVVPGGCHETPEKALRHQRALMVNVEDAAQDNDAQKRREAIRGLMD